MSFTSIFVVVKALADLAVTEARLVFEAEACGLNYDNLNLSSSIFVEQTSSTMSKVSLNNIHNAVTD